MPSSLLAACVDFARHAPAVVFGAAASVVGLAAAVCCYCGFDALHRSRLIADMPTSKLRSAAQGYVELDGHVKMMPGEPVFAPLSGLPCVWYSYSVEQTGRDVYHDAQSGGMLERGISEAIFHLADETGVCIVDPDGAEVTPSVRLCWRGDSPRPLYVPKQTGFWARLFSFGAYRYTECRLHDYDPVYAVGQFVRAGEGEPMGVSDATRELLVTWKRDRAGLLRRFDADRNGKIDLDEWENARQSAEREVIATWEERQPQPDMNVLKKPAHGRPFVLSTVTQDRLIVAYRRKAPLGFAGFLALGLALAWAVGQRLG